MRDSYEIRGCFYSLKGWNCRRYLDIRRKDIPRQEPDLLVVMMNPGQSKPVGGILDIETEAVPDRTQRQIMQVMDICGFEYCRILNLTDIQETKSKNLFAILVKPSTQKVAHSIFDPRRRKEFFRLYPKKAKVVLAWGVADELTELARLAEERIGDVAVFGLRKENGKTAYYHPLPPSYPKQQEWVREITKQLNTMQK